MNNKNIILKTFGLSQPTPKAECEKINSIFDFILSSEILSNSSLSLKIASNISLLFSIDF